MRDLRALPKAHLHLHLTGSMRPATARDLAARHGLPLAPLPSWEQALARDWAYFQQPYDACREAIRTAADVERVVREAAEDDAADGSGWLELQVDPTSYAPLLGGLEATVEVMLDAARSAARATGIGIGIVVASSWARPARHAEALARLATRYEGEGVVGFGLSNDERCGQVADFAGAFRIAREAGLPGAPHGGFFEGAWHVRDCVDLLGARRIGHGIRAVEDPRVLELLTTRGIALEVCPTSYTPLGVIGSVEEVPLRRLRDAGVPVALGADDPLLFGTGLAGQYALARDVLGFGDAELAEFARCSIRWSAAPEETKAQLLARVNAWLG
jgi:adenosine deaminase